MIVLAHDSYHGDAARWNELRWSEQTQQTTTEERIVNKVLKFKTIEPINLSTDSEDLFVGVEKKNKTSMLADNGYGLNSQDQLETYGKTRLRKCGYYYVRAD